MDELRRRYEQLPLLGLRDEQLSLADVPVAVPKPLTAVDWAEHPVTFFRQTEWDWDEKRAAFEQARGRLSDAAAEAVP